MTDEEIIRRLAWLRDAKPGDQTPDWMGGPNEWSKAISELAKEAINLISWSAVKIQEANRKLEQ